MLIKQALCMSILIKPWAMLIAPKSYHTCSCYELCSCHELCPYHKLCLKYDQWPCHNRIIHPIRDDCRLKNWCFFGKGCVQRELLGHHETSQWEDGSGTSGRSWGAIMSLKPKQMITYLLEKSQLTSIGAHISKSEFSILHLTISLLWVLGISHCSLLGIPVQHIRVPLTLVMSWEMIGDSCNTCNINMVLEDTLNHIYLQTRFFSPGLGSAPR